MKSGIKKSFKASPWGRFGRAFLQAAALIVIAASAIVAAATSHHAVDEKCDHEWEMDFEKAGTAKDNSFISTPDFLYQLK